MVLQQRCSPHGVQRIFNCIILSIIELGIIGLETPNILIHATENFLSRTILL